LINILLTGIPGIGKTTIIKKVVSLCPMSAGGFFTQEIREQGKRKGFHIIDIHTKKEGILAHVAISSPYRVGKYGVDLRGFEEIGVKALEDALETKDLIVIDEIGKMELFSDLFQKTVLMCLSSSKRVLGSIKLKGNPFVDSIKKRTDVNIIEVNEKNRDFLPAEMLHFITGKTQ
jgi:nucleoside-triphosphatase